MLRQATWVLVLGFVTAHDAGAEPRPFTATYEGGVSKTFRHGRLLTTPDGERWLVLSEDRHRCDDPAWTGKHHALAIFDAKLTRARLITFNTSERCWPVRNPTIRITVTGTRATGTVESAVTRGASGGGDFDVVVCN